MPDPEAIRHEKPVAFVGTCPNAVRGLGCGATTKRLNIDSISSGMQVKKWLFWIWRVAAKR